MTGYAVHWHEGIFLRPHHFQLSQRYWAEQAAQGNRWDCHYNWGIRHIDVDPEALANYRVVVRSLQARLRDGTQVVVGDDRPLPPLSLRHAFDRGGKVTVHVAVASHRPGRANIAAPGKEDARFAILSEEMEDENSGSNPQPIQLRSLNVRLLLSTQDLSGYEVLPLLRVERSAQAEAVPQLDESYIPPVLACDAWRPLQAGILHNILDRVGKKIQLLASLAVSRGITFDTHNQGDAQTLAQLRALNETSAVLRVLGGVQGVHPLTLYTELCRAVGQLAVFGETRCVPELPLYDHEDLGGCFTALKQHLDGLLSGFVEPEFKERPFVGTGLRMQVSLEPSWLEAGWEMYVGVQSSLEARECIDLLTKPGQLDVKIGSSERVDSLFRHGQAGLRFGLCSHRPRALPEVPGQVYFQLERSPPTEWQYVQRSLSLALRLNEHLVVGDIQGQRTLTIRVGGQTTRMQFTLYVVGSSAAESA